MPASATHVFDFLEQTNEINIVRYEVTQTAFSMLRRSLRQVSFKLYDSDDQEGHDISVQLKAVLSQWLTAPIPFGHLIQEAVSELFGSTETVQDKWGKDISELYESALTAAVNLKTIKNPTRSTVREIIKKQRTDDLEFKIYCDRRAKQYFGTILTPPDDLPIDDNVYLHTLKDYREAEPFDTLIKFGSLRSSGWGSAPDAILTAPRFRTLNQVVWSGCKDEEGFGYDPTLSISKELSGGQNQATDTNQPGTSFVKINLEIIHTGNEGGSGSDFQNDMDDLQLLKDLRKQGDDRSAILLQLGEKHGMLYPPHSRALSYDPDKIGMDTIAERIPGDSLTEGMFLIVPLVDEIEFDGVRAKHGHYSKAWKAVLKQEFQNDANGLVKRLRSAGLNLLHLRTAVRNWCHPPSTVIHAPQYQRHFNILLKTIGFRGDTTIGSGKQIQHLFRSAWNEVRRSRGEAIQAGVQAHEIITEELLGTLNKFLPDIRDKVSTDQIFTITIPDRYELHGPVIFLKVNGIEPGFRVPGSELKTIRELDEIDQWRE